MSVTKATAFLFFFFVIFYFSLPKLLLFVSLQFSVFDFGFCCIYRSALAGVFHLDAIQVRPICISHYFRAFRLGNLIRFHFGFVWLRFSFTFDYCKRSVDGRQRCSDAFDYDNDYDISIWHGWGGLHMRQWKIEIKPKAKPHFK